MSRGGWRALVLVGTLTFAVYVPSLWNGFVWDDEGTVLDNPHYRGLAFSNLRWMFTHFRLGHYQPLSWATLGLDYVIFGMNPVGYHLTNIILHALAAVVFASLAANLFRAARHETRAEAGRGEGARISEGSSRSSGPAVWFGAAVALAWSLHPLRVEAVSWVTQRREVLCGLLTLLAISGHVRLQRWWLTAVLSACAMLAKVTAVTIPLVLVLIDVYREGGLGAPGWFGGLTRSVMRKGHLFFMAAALSVIAVLAQKETSALVSSEFLPIPSRVALYFYGGVFCLLKTLWPSGLAPLHQGQIGLSWRLEPFVWGTALGGLALAILVLTVAWRLRHRVPGALVLTSAFLIMIAPAGGLGQSGPQIAAERYTYQPGWILTFGIGWILAKGTGWFVRAGWQSVVPLALVLGALGWASIIQQRCWRDPEALWKRELAVHPDSAFGNFVLGFHYLKQDAPDFRAAEAPLRRAVALASDYVDAERMLAGLLGDTGRSDEAIETLGVFVREHPDNSESWRLLGKAQAAWGRPRDALATFERGIAAAPSPGLLRDFAWLLATHPDPAIRDGRRAFELATRAVTGVMVDGKMVVMLAAASAEAGDFETAQRVVEEAIARLPEDQRSALEHLLADLQKRQPIRANPRFP